MSNLTTGAYNIGIGSSSGLGLTTQGNSIFIGRNSASNATGGDYNIGIGGSALNYIASSYNTVVGALSLDAATSGQRNTAIGYGTLSDLTTGSFNVAISMQALRVNNGDYNVGIGYQAGYNATTFEQSTIIGSRAALNATGGTAVIAIGYGAGYNNQANNNVFIGSNAGYAVTTGISNITVGTTTGFNLVDGNYNILLGASAGRNLVTSNHNIGIGVNSLYYNEDGDNNIAIGYAALFGADGQSLAYNLAIGYQAGYGNQTGERNIFIGYQAGYSNQTGERNVFIGYRAGYSETGSDKLYISNSDTTTPLIYGEFDGGSGVGVKIHTPTSTAVGFTVKGASSQTANLTEWQDSGGTKLASVDQYGGAVFNETGLSTADFLVKGDTQTNLFKIKASTDQVNIGSPDGGGLGKLYVFDSVAGFSATSRRGVEFDIAAKYGADNTKYYVAQGASLTVRDAYNYSNATNGLVVYQALFQNTVASTVALARAQVAVGVFTNGTTTTFVNYDVVAPTVTSGLITNLYGLRIGNMTAGGTLNYAIYTNAGAVHLGDKLEFTQTDGNEYIDSLNDGYMDYGATTAHRFNSTVKSSGGRIQNITEVTTATYSVLTSDDYISIQYTDTGTQVTTLPAISASNHGQRYTLKDADYNAITNSITINPTGTDTIDELSSWILNMNGDAISLKANNSTKNWEVY